MPALGRGQGSTPQLPYPLPSLRAQAVKEMASVVPGVNYDARDKGHLEPVLSYLVARKE